jgi:hypothetical protein
MRDKNTINRATFERCAKGFLFHVDCGAGLLGETYAFNTADEAARWLADQFVAEEGWAVIDPVELFSGK